MHKQKADNGTDHDRCRIRSENAQAKVRHGALEHSQLDEVAYQRHNQVLPDLATPVRAAIAKGPQFREGEVRGESYDKGQRETDLGTKEMHENPQ